MSEITPNPESGSHKEDSPAPFWFEDGPEASKPAPRFTSEPKSPMGPPSAPASPLPRRSLVDGDTPSGFLDAPRTPEEDSFGGGLDRSRETAEERRARLFPPDDDEDFGRLGGGAISSWDSPVRPARFAAGSGDPDPRRTSYDDPRGPKAPSPEDELANYDATPQEKKKRRFLTKRNLGIVGVAGVIYAVGYACGGFGLSDDRDALPNANSSVVCKGIGAQLLGPVEDRVQYEYRASASAYNGATIERVHYSIDHPGDAKNTEKDVLKSKNSLVTKFTIGKHIIHATVYGKEANGTPVKTDCRGLELTVRRQVGQETGN